ncbi:MAG: hypothetical protein V3W11_10620, partial [bacterium]
MEKLLDRGIKEVIDEYPGVGEVLEAYEIGCVPCNVGTCLLRDVVEIHALSAQAEREMFAKIAALVFPGQEVELPRLRREEAAG